MVFCALLCYKLIDLILYGKSLWYAHQEDIPLQFGLFLYGTSQFGWGTLLERRIIAGLYLRWDQFIGELVLTWLGCLVAISSFVL